MTQYTDPAAESTTVYNITDGVPTVEEIAAQYPDFSFNDHIVEPTVLELALQARSDIVYSFQSVYGKTSQGTVTISFLRDGVAVPGFQNIQFTVSGNEFFPTGVQGVALGQRLSIDITDGSGTPRNFEYTLACKRS